MGAASAQLGPNVAALVAEFHTELGMPVEKVVRVLQTLFGLHVTKGGLVQLLHRTADAAAPAYAVLRGQVRRSPVVTPDETGWRVNALRYWPWAFATPETTVYAICDGRGFAEAAAVLGPDFAGVLVRDGWVAYRGFKDIIVIGINAARERDAGGALSADTSLDEMLLIGKKKGGRATAESGAETITYVTLNEAPGAPR